MLSSGHGAAHARVLFGSVGVNTSINWASLDFALTFTRTRNRAVSPALHGAVAVTLADLYDFDNTTGKNIPFEARRFGPNDSGFDIVLPK